jgi:hypothetical protein
MPAATWIAQRYVSVLVGVVLLSLGLVTGARAAQPLASQDTNIPDVVAEITKCPRKEGVLTIQMRLRNTGGSTTSFYAVDGRNYDQYYLISGSKKYFMLRDTEKTPLAPAPDGGGNIRVELAPGASWTWWAQYPAPPAEVTSITYYTPLAPPIEDVPVSD